MSRYDPRLNFHFRIVLLIYGVLLAIGLPGAFILLNTERDATVSSYQESALTLAKTIELHLRSDMLLNEGPQHMHEELASVVTPDGRLKSAMILSNTQQVFASSDSSEMGQRLNWPAVAQAIATGKPQYVDYGNEANQLAVVLPVKNAPDCQTCHGSQESTRGAISVYIDRGPLNAQLREQAQLMGLIGGVTFLCVGLALTYTLRRGIVHPVEKVVADIDAEQKKHAQLLFTDRLASIGELTSGIAHELNNPLTSVIGFSELLLQKDLPPEIREDMQIVNDEAKRTATIVKNLLTFARRQPQDKQLMDINEAIRKVLELRTYEQSVNNIRVETHYDPELPKIKGNSSQLQQVFFNIIINAEFFMLQAHKRGTLTITTARSDGSIRASFKDDGPGISADTMKRLFHPFFTTKEVGKGSGLGLSISLGIVEEHGGKMWAESGPGEGATFIVEFPVQETPPRLPMPDEGEPRPVSRQGAQADGRAKQN